MSNQSEPASLQSLISEALEQSDSFAFEMKILRRLKSYLPIQQRSRVEIGHGGVFIDPVEEKRRQFDIRADFEKDRCRLLLAIECKRLHESAPVVVSNVDRGSDESFHCLIGTPSAGPREVRMYRTEKFSELYPYQHRVGKSIATLAAKDNKNPSLANDSGIYDRYAQAINSVESMLADACRRASVTHELTGGMSQWLGALPMVVVPDGCLWTVYYDAAGNRMGGPEQSDSAELFLGREVQGLYKSGRFVLSHLHVLTETGFSRMMGALLGQNPHGWINLFREGGLQPSK